MLVLQQELCVFKSHSQGQGEKEAWCQPNLLTMELHKQSIWFCRDWINSLQRWKSQVFRHAPASIPDPRPLFYSTLALHHRLLQLAFLRVLGPPGAGSRRAPRTAPAAPAPPTRLTARHEGSFFVASGGYSVRTMYIWEEVNDGESNGRTQKCLSLPLTETALAHPRWTKGWRKDTWDSQSPVPLASSSSINLSTAFLTFPHKYLNNFSVPHVCYWEKLNSKAQRGSEVS